MIKASIYLARRADISPEEFSSEYQQVVIPDEEKFLDRSKTSLYLTTEHSITG